MSHDSNPRSTARKTNNSQECLWQMRKMAKFLLGKRFWGTRNVLHGSQRCRVGQNLYHNTKPGGTLEEKTQETGSLGDCGVCGLIQRQIKVIYLYQNELFLFYFSFMIKTIDLAWNDEAKSGLWPFYNRLKMRCEDHQFPRILVQIYRKHILWRVMYTYSNLYVSPITCTSQ